MKNIQLQRYILLSLGLIKSGVGIHVEEKCVRIAEVRKSGSGFVISRFAMEMFSEDFDELSPEQQSDAVSSAIQKCLKQFGVKPSQIVSGPSSVKVVTRYFEIPSVGKKELSEAIRFEGSRFVPFRLDETVFSYEANGVSGKSSLGIVFNAIRIDTLKAHVKQIESTGIKLLDCEPPFHALARALEGQFDPNGSALLVHFSASGDIFLCFLKAKILYVCRDFYVSFSDDNSINKFFMEVESSFEYFKKLTGDLPLSQVFIAGNGDLNLWKERLAQNFDPGLKINIASFPTEKPEQAAESSAYMISAGLAMKAMGIRSPVGEVSLLQSGAVFEERFAPRKWTGAAILAILLISVGFYFGYFIPTANQLKKMLQKAATRATELSYEAPEFATQSASELERKVQDIQTKTQLIESFKRSQSFLSKKFTLLSQTIPAFMWFSGLSYEESIGIGGALGLSSRKLQLSGYIYFREIPEEELRRVNEYAESLQKSPEFMEGFQNFKLEGIERITYQDRRFTKFRITAS